MKKKFRFLLLIMLMVVAVSMISNTYSRYVADTTGNVEMALAKWQILVNENDIVTNTSSSINFTPIIDENVNVSNDTLAPSSTGYFDIDVNPSNVDLSFRYSINLNINGSTLPDVMISKYEILDETKVSDPLNIIDIENNLIENTLLYNSTIENYKHEAFTIRVYFEWYENTDNLMDDEADTAAGLDAAVNDTKFTMTASINFEQII